MSYTYKKSIFAPITFPILPTINGMTISTSNSGIKYQDRDDLLCVRFDTPAVTAAVFTKSSMPSAAIDWCRHCMSQSGLTSCLVVNAGNANAFTGKAGALCCKNVAQSLSVHEKCPETQIFQASTGVIGEKLDGNILAKKIIQTTKNCTFEAAAKSIMTTDTFAKGFGETFDINGTPVSISGIAKGSGMIAPNMGTMLAFIFTDADIEQEVLQSLVCEITETSFNAITVDGDTSTSDTLAVFATGKSLVKIQSSDDISIFKQALNRVMTDLALQIVKDGEGLTKFVTITVQQAKDNLSARKIGLSVANSPLVKTAIAGEDPNWGRIIAAIGKSGEPADRDKTCILIGGMMIAEQGEAVENYNETPVVAYMKHSHIEITVLVGVGEGEAVVYTTDLTHDYIDINADYRS
ncbi:MAG: glutamate N-acetyltransferase/amino-acid N-acetyltransferase [Alphaproteobacteria bacterium]|jgi:glutamate N-acetyltransferase/amino-acid N-acetyltransferase